MAWYLVENISNLKKILLYQVKWIARFFSKTRNTRWIFVWLIPFLTNEMKTFSWKHFIYLVLMKVFCSANKRIFHSGVHALSRDASCGAAVFNWPIQIKFKLNFCRLPMILVYCRCKYRSVIDWKNCCPKNSFVGRVMLFIFL